MNVIIVSLRGSIPRRKVLGFIILPEYNMAAIVDIHKLGLRALSKPLIFLLFQCLFDKRINNN